MVRSKTELLALLLGSRHSTTTLINDKPCWNSQILATHALNHYTNVAPLMNDKPSWKSQILATHVLNHYTNVAPLINDKPSWNSQILTTHALNHYTNVAIFNQTLSKCSSNWAPLLLIGSKSVDMKRKPREKEETLHELVLLPKTAVTENVSF